MAQGFEESAAIVRAMLDAGLDAIVAMDGDGTILEFNRAAEEMFGYRREEVLGRPLADCIVPPASREAHRRGVARRVAEDVGPILGERVQLTAMRSNGEEFPVELTVTRRGEPEPPPDRLVLQRELWMDLDGDGFTVRDNLSGELNRTWRLDLEPPGALGHVSVGGEL